MRSPRTRRSPRLAAKKKLKKRKNDLTGGLFSDVGTTACVISPAIGGSEHHVSKIFKIGDNEVDNQNNLQSYRRETNVELLRLLRENDPRGERFCYASSAHPVDIHLTAQQSDDVLRCLGRRVLSSADLVFYNMPLVHPTVGKLNMTQRLFLSDSLDILHELGIVHGDLHKDNVMLGSDGLPRIIDFGRATLSRDQKLKDKDTEEYNKYFGVSAPVSGPKKARGRRASLTPREGRPNSRSRSPRGAGGAGGGGAARTLFDAAEAE